MMRTSGNVQNRPTNWRLSLGMKKLTQPYFTEISGKRFCLGHGDGIGGASMGFRFIRKVFHNRILQALFSSLHPWIAFRLGKGWSRRNRLSHKDEYVWKGSSEPLYKWASEFSAGTHVDYFIFGHFHAQVDQMLPSGARFLMLKDWFKSSQYLYFDGISVGVGHSMKTE